MCEKVRGLRIGKYGQLQEWVEEFEEAVPNHRHMTHLIALYLSGQITPRRTPDLAKGGRVSIERRSDRGGGVDVEWSRGNLINFYARLLDAEAAHESLRLLLTKLSGKNLMTVSVAGIAGASGNIFVIDGKTSGINGMAEMLLQSHSGEIYLLPALPKAWPVGKVTGLKAGGGYEVDISWIDGAVTEVVIRGERTGACTVRTASRVCVMKGNARIEAKRLEPSVGQFPVAAGETYRVFSGEG